MLQGSEANVLPVALEPPAEALQTKVKSALRRQDGSGRQRSLRRVRFADALVSAVYVRPRTAEHERPLLYYGEQAYEDFSREAAEEERLARRMRKRKKRAALAPYMAMGGGGYMLDHARYGHDNHSAYGRRNDMYNSHGYAHIGRGFN